MSFDTVCVATVAEAPEIDYALTTEKVGSRGHKDPPYDLYLSIQAELVARGFGLRFDNRVKRDLARDMQYHPINFNL